MADPPAQLLELQAMSPRADGNIIARPAFPGQYNGPPRDSQPAGSLCQLSASSDIGKEPSFPVASLPCPAALLETSSPIRNPVWRLCFIDVNSLHRQHLNRLPLSPTCRPCLLHKTQPVSETGELTIGSGVWEPRGAWEIAFMQHQQEMWWGSQSPGPLYCTVLFVPVGRTDGTVYYSPFRPAAASFEILLHSCRRRRSSDKRRQHYDLSGGQCSTLLELGVAREQIHRDVE